MKFIILTYVMTLFSFCQNVDGNYKSENGSEIILNNKTFHFRKQIIWKNMTITETISISEGNYDLKDNLIFLSSHFDLSKKLDEIFLITQINKNLNEHIEISFNNFNPDYDIFVCNVLNEFYDEKMQQWTNQTDFCLKLKK